MKQRIGYQFKLISDKLRVHEDIDLKSCGVTMTQGRILNYLSDRGGIAAQKEIEDHLQVSHPTVVGLVSRLEQNGFVETWYNPKDRRSKVVGLTEKAKRCNKSMEEVLERRDRVLLQGLSEEEQEELKRLLAIIQKNIT